ncbi:MULTISPECIES: choline ABC transporter ATP-binding protein [Mesorhizobium]|jgi:glycine betaine/proline transport system ATP-binding protein|uniref:choline ABC transporter ATP-binding protein n=1 Tax=Mesorhizobium TaxID=68287 RepID=UPI000FE346DB|nr:MULTISPECIES: choline ABC transporter ATP-binding protein [Mesorhizobium]MCF6108847.1 choline ABC transporter ATP-binding protein [Mesorhizobium muleiense]RWC06649.1 MAG: choline ABC transporter ATP-binding protein [Mesorhizobium sp.]RWP09237.1 MAG: choline ABC transporter ATP-binding protein [Mesorhizobium sp.]RWP31303.1 MAG: choline ABC transporter ATP-binding protein [Mesorhizobium sp.]RWP69405.1 MAG: choline ABC transporter ATP-binding protein [Mesorhizobium sp.]
MSAAVDFKNVDIVFGAARKEALALVDRGATRQEILEKTGAVLGCAGANLTVNEGEISVLMGLSGSGKSTLLRAVNLLNVPARGNVMVKDGDRMVDVAACDAATLRHIRQTRVAMVFQQFGLLPWRTVAENVGFGLELSGVPEAERKARVERQLKLVGLDQWASKYAHELSGGMQQRVGLARAFATEAPILLMDEPFSALDPLIRTKLQDELLQLQAELKKTIIFVSHDLEEALKIGSHITIMEGGRIVQTGAPEDIVLRPANDYVRDFIANVNPLSVLTAWNVMRDRRDLDHGEDGWVWLDRRKTTRFKIDEHGLVAAAERDGKPAFWVSCADVEAQPEETTQVFWANPGTSLKTVMLAMHRSQTAPVALFDDQSRFVGAIGIRDVLSAVLRR